jgi:capsular polysaccharide biosynthesis protein/Mrp family chromosome partitioning ATPase
MEARPSPDQAQVADFGAMLRRRWWVVVAGGIVGLLLALEIITLATKTYTATASVLVTSTGIGSADEIAGGRTSGEINLDTEAQLLTSIDVATRAQALLKSPEDPRALADRVMATVPPNTSVLEVSFSAGTPEDAQRGAQAFATAYLDARKATAATRVAEQVKSLQSQIATLQKSLQDVTGKIAALPESSPDHAYAVAQQNVLVNQISQLNARLSPLLGSSIVPGRTITNAKLPTVPASPNPMVYLLSGLLGGLLVGLALAVLLQRVDRRVHSAADVRRAAGLPVLCSVPIKSLSALAAGFNAPASPTGQAFRRLRNLLVARYSGAGNIVLVAGVSRGATGSVVATNLASALARSGARTVLVCADLQSRSFTPLVGMPESAGLAEVLLGTASLNDVRRSVPGLPRLQVVGPGRSIDAAADRAQSDELIDVLQALQQERSAFVVVEAPPTSTGADAQALAALADVVILAVEARQTLRRDVADAMVEFSGVQAEVIGAVIVTFTRRVLRRARRTAAAEGSSDSEPIAELALNNIDVPTEELADVRRRW